jgi:hypothetical protein
LLLCVLAQVAFGVTIPAMLLASTQPATAKLQSNVASAAAKLLLMQHWDGTCC